MSSGAENHLQPTQEGSIKDQAELDNFEQTKPGKDSKVILINNPGNPVFSCPTEAITYFTESQEEDCFEGYSVKKQNPMYMTSAMEYGSRRPTVHTMPNSFHAKCQKFTDHLGKCGMYRNQSLNTSMDKSIV